MATKRENKGKNLFVALDNFTAIDIETTGLSSEYDNIIELAAIKYRNGKPVEQFDQLINPGYEVGGFVTYLTGITDAMLSTAPSIDQVLPSFIDFLSDDVLLGHNIHFDINFIYDNCCFMGLPPIQNDFVDTMRISRRLYKDWENHRLDTMLAEFELYRILHRALNDAKLTAQAYLIMQQNPMFEDAAKAVLTKKHYIRTTPQQKLSAKDITANSTYFDEDSPVYSKMFVFTGKLDSLTRKEAMQAVVDMGGKCNDRITKETNFLVLGNTDYRISMHGEKTNKIKSAEKLILSGADLTIIPETVFLDMLKYE